MATKLLSPKQENMINFITEFLRDKGYPLVGEIAAGKPIPVPASESKNTIPVAKVEVSRDLIPGKGEVYALRVKSDSMLDALIEEGDVVLMEYTGRAENGDRAAVWLKREQKVTLKKFYVEADFARLQPANNQMKPIYTTLNNVEIQGRVLAVIRRMA